MEKIEIKLKECCLTCEHFDPSGIKGLGFSFSCCGESERVIACGHMEVCKMYLGEDPEKKRWRRGYLPNFGMQTVYVCPECHGICLSEKEKCPQCGIILFEHEEKS